MPTATPPSAAPLARQARERFVAHMQGVLPELSEAIRNALTEQMALSESSREMQQRRDALLEYEQNAARWVDASAQAWRRAIVPATLGRGLVRPPEGLELSRAATLREAIDSAVTRD